MLEDIMHLLKQNLKLEEEEKNLGSKKEQVMHVLDLEDHLYGSEVEFHSDQNHEQ